MSRTDVHAPYWVKARDPQWRTNFREAHDHSTGECDLDRLLAARQWVRTRCTIELDLADANICCGCRLCTGHHDRKLSRRRDRARLRADLRTAVKTPIEDRDDLDIFTPPRMTAYSVYGSTGADTAGELDPTGDPWRLWRDFTIVLLPSD